MNGNKMGPNNQGPRTGRGMGNCPTQDNTRSENEVEYQNPIRGMGFGRNRGMGFGMGFGRRNGFGNNIGRGMGQRFFRNREINLRESK